MANLLALAEAVGEDASLRGEDRALRLELLIRVRRGVAGGASSPRTSSHRSAGPTAGWSLSGTAGGTISRLPIRVDSRVAARSRTARSSRTG